MTTLTKLASAAALMAAMGLVNAAPVETLNGVGVGAGDITYVPFSWNGDDDGFHIGTFGSSADPELFLLNSAGTVVLRNNDDGGPGLESLLSYDGSAGDYWLGIGRFDTTNAEVLAGANPGVGALTTNLRFSANDRSGHHQGDFSNVGPSTTTPPSQRVPEPASLVLAGLALGVAGLVGRLRKRA
ncbi:MAG: hypothetical protein LKCHEGNO_01785 [Burkholderiaceae bacterium]|nr:hypothetical protein [Burkholderiaceae bacterium]